eukprot:scaffold1870_cov337-Prasinococcus_capsulatus_cf.AAC.2
MRAASAGSGTSAHTVRLRPYKCGPARTPATQTAARGGGHAPCHATSCMRRIPCKQTMRTTSARTSVPRLGTLAP